MAGRPTKEAAAAKIAAAEQAKTIVEPVKTDNKVEENLNEGIASYAGVPHAGSHAAVLAKEEAAQAAVSQTDNVGSAGQTNLLDLNSSPAASPEPPKPEPKLITQEFLDENPFLAEMGVSVGENQDELTNLITDEDLVNIAELENNEGNPFKSFLLAGVAVGDTRLQALSKMHSYDQAEKLKAATQEGKYIYHGDHLTKAQLGEQVTYDWDEVTAPEHLYLK